MTSQGQFEDYVLLTFTPGEIHKLTKLMAHDFKGVLMLNEIREILDEGTFMTNCKHKQYLLQLISTSLDGYTKKQFIDRYIYIQNLCPSTAIQKGNKQKLQ
jgi:hypothetical protein